MRNPHQISADGKKEIKRELRDWSRHELQNYLESWGYQVYDFETLDDLRDAAYKNAVAEGGL